MISKSARPISKPQGSQQLRQLTNSVSKQKMNSLTIWIAVLVTAFIFGVGGFLLGAKRNNQSNLLNNSTPTTAQSRTEQSTTKTQPKISPPIDVSPISNSLYLGTYQGKEALFITNSKLSEYYDNGVKKISKEVGILEQSNGSGEQPFRYNELTNPIRIASFETTANIIGVGNFKLNSDNSRLYVVVDSQPTGTQYVKQELYQVDLANYSKKLVWSHNIGSNKYPKAGPALIDIIESDKYIVLSLGICYPCDEFEPHGSVILNLQTGAEKYLGEIGNLRFNLTDNTLSYKKLASFDEACEPSPGCDDGKRIVYKPSGEVFTLRLP